jgi:YD repeat-containing protein
MVAIVAGAGLGLERSSALVLGGAGQLGQAVLGRGSDNVYVNAASGNLVVQGADEMLFGLGPDSVIGRSYNSQAGTGANWQTNLARRVGAVTGTVNTAGSTVKRIAWDGSDIDYAYDTTRGLYVAREGGGGYDTLSFASATQTWTWTDGASRTVETYDGANGGRLTRSTDADGNYLDFTYVGGALTRVTTQEGGYTELAYTGSLLTSLVTHDKAGGGDVALTRIRYGYDGSGRLTTVTVDLTPLDNSVGDYKTYVTTYGYDGTSTRVNSITQAGGANLAATTTNLAVTYVLSGGVYRVETLTQTVGGVSRQTQFVYNTATRVTTVTDPLGQATLLGYDTTGQLTSVSAPAVGSAAAQVTAFTYNAKGDIQTITAPDGGVVTYGYDANGNRTSEVDGVGNTVTRTFGAKNELLTETRYLVAAQGQAASAPLTTRYVYDANNHLRFVIGAEGAVSEYRYSASGLQTSAIQYTTNRKDVSGLSATSAPTLSDMTTWLAAISDKSKSKRTDTTYDFRGNIDTVKSFGKVNADGTGDATATSEISTVTYIYDQAGRLLRRQPTGVSNAETYLYDGLGRVIATTDFASQTTTVAFDDALTTTTVSVSNGPIKTSTYNAAGELVSYVETGAGVTSATTEYRYDAAGRLRIVKDAAGLETHSLYDAAGRKIAEVAPGGILTEFRYNVADQLITTIRYAGKLGSGQMLALKSGANPSATVTLADIRPAAVATDRWEWRIYDKADRLVETIDATGAATVYAYDGASRLISTTSYASLLSAATLTGFKTAPPSMIQTPGGGAAVAFAAAAAANTGPAAATDTVTTTRDVTFSFNPRANDVDPDGDVLTITAVTQGAHGVVTFTDGMITYKPAAGYVGTDTFGYTISDGRGGSASGTVNMTVAAPANSGPVAANDRIIVSQGGSLAFDPRGNDIDADGDVLTVTAVTQGAHGATSIDANGLVVYTPTAGYVGADGFTYTVSDGRGGVSSASVVVSVTASNNTAPVATGDSIITEQGTAANFNPRVNDSDADGDILVVAGVGSASHGSVVLNSNGTITYTPSAGYVGSDSFTYTVSDGRGATATGVINVTVTSTANNAPVLASDTIVTSKGAAISFNPRANDVDPDGDGLTITAVSQAAHGAVTFANGLVTYTPAANYVGADSFTYTVSDGRGGIVTGAVSVTVFAANEFTGLVPASVHEFHDGLTGINFTATAAPNYLGEGYNALLIQKTLPANVTPEYNGFGTTAGSVNINGAATGDAVWNVTDGERLGVAIEAKALGATTHVQLSVIYWNADWSYAGESTTISAPVTAWGRVELEVNSPVGARYASVVVQPIAEGNQMGAKSFGVAIRKAQLVRLTANQTTPPWQAPTPVNTAPVAANDAVLTNQGVPLTFNPKLNDSDVDRDVLTLTAVTQGAHGAVTLNGAGTITYAPVAGYVGPDSFTYTIADGRGGTHTATVTVTVAAPSGSNSAPVAATDAIFTSQGVAINFNPKANDGDADGDALSIGALSAPAHGAVTLNNDGTVTYTPTGGYVGPDSFTYVLSDGRGGAVTGLVNVTVATGNGNTAPSALADTISTPQNVAKTFNPRLNDSDADGDALSVTVVGQAAHGVAVLNTDGSITYTPTAGYAGADSFTYTISDGRGGAATATVNLTVVAPAANTAPTAANDAVSTNKNVAVVFNPRLNDADADGDGLAITAVGSAGHGTVSFNSGLITYTPTNNYVGADSFTYTISDGRGGVQTATVNVTVYAANELPALSTSLIADWSDGGTGVNYTKSVDGNYLGEGFSTLLLTKSPGATKPPYTGGYTRPGAAQIIGPTSALQWAVTPGERLGVAFDAKGLGATTHVTVTVQYWTGAWGDGGVSTAVTVPISSWGHIETVLTVPANAAWASVIVEPMASGDQRNAASFGLAIRKSQFVRLATGQAMQPWPATTPSNTVPTAGADALAATAGQSVAFNPRINDADADKDQLTVSAVGTPSHGTASINGAGTITYMPTAGYVGPDSFTYTISDGRGGTATATVNVTVSAPAANVAPTAATDAVSTTQGTPFSFDPRVNDTDANADPLTITGVTQGGHGAVTFSAGTLTYTPATGYVGADSFTYTISDGRGGVATATVNMTVTATAPNTAPTAAADVIATNKNVAIIFDPRLNDADADGDGLAITGVGTAAHGTLTINGAGTITYTPTSNYVGADSFTYTISDGRGGTQTATVSVTVYAVNELPSLTTAMVADWSDGGTGLNYTKSVDGNYLGEGFSTLLLTKSPGATKPPYTGGYTRPGAAQIIGPTSSLQWAVTPGERLGVAFEAKGLGATTHVTVTVQYWTGAWGDGGVSTAVTVPISAWGRVEPVLTVPANAAWASVIVEPVASGDQRNAASFGLAVRKTQFVRLATGQTMQAWPAAAPVNTAPNAVADTLSTPVGQAASFNPRLNDTDANKDQLTITTVGSPSHGSTALSGGLITYTPTAGYVGPDSFTYTVSDGRGGQATATVTVAVTAVINTAPTANADPVLTFQGQAATFNPRLNDSDPEGDALTVSIASPPSRGLAVANADGTITYTPDAGYIGLDSFTYMIADGHGGTATATVSVTVVSPVNTTPVAANDAVLVFQGELVTFNPRQNDNDPDGDPLVISAVGTAGHGQAIINAGGTITYTPTAGYVGPDSFTYTILDGRGGSATATVSVTIDTRPNNGPVAADDVALTTRGVPVLLDPRINDADADSDALTVTGVGAASHGTAAMQPNGQVLYTPTAGYVGDDSFIYTVSDGRGGSKTATVRITVSAPSNTGPSAVNDRVSTSKGMAVTVYVRNNDGDINGDALTVATIGPVANGSAVIENGAIIYTPNATFTGLETFTYTISDGRGGEASATVTVEVIQPAATPVVLSADDRQARNFYNSENQLIGRLDAEGYLTQIKYDAAGQEIETIGFYNAASANLRQAGTFADLLASIAPSDNDIHGWTLRDARGFMMATINGDGQLTRYQYSPLGDVSQVTVGQRLNVATLLTTPPTLATLPAGGGVIETTTFTRNAFGQVLTEVRSGTNIGGGAVSETTTYVYDSMRRLVTRTAASGTSDARAYNQTYDVKGRLTGALSGEGSAVLASYGATPTAAQITDTYAKYGVTYVYDAADRLVKMTEANGADAGGVRTLYYYDDTGRLTYTINGLGEVTQSVYDSFGQRVDAIAYGTRIASGTLAGLSGGVINAALTSAVSGVTNASLDSKIHFDYDNVGRLSQLTDALSAATTYGYSAFGDQTSVVAPVTAAVTVQTTRLFDRRGLMRSETRDATGLKLTTGYAYDAFGRTMATTDPTGQVRSATYDRAGRVMSTTDALNQTTGFSYDGRGAMISRTDRNGRISTWAYDAFNRTTVMTTPEGVVTTTTANAHGQIVSIKDGANRTTTWTYDKDGQIKTVSDAAGLQLTNSYDKAGRLEVVTDAANVSTVFTYDAVDRVLSRKIDSGGLNLLTTYAFDAKGQQTDITEAAGTSAARVTTIAFDLAGRQTRVTVDSGSGRLGLATTYDYDKSGRVVKVTEAADTLLARVTENVYDKAGRLMSSTVDPAGLALVTAYAYDKNGNAVARTDAAGGITRFVYDAENRQILAIDPVGDVVATRYDAEGRVASTRAYATPIAAATLAGMGLQVSAAAVNAAAAEGSGDAVTGYVYDGDGRLRFVVQPDQRLVGYDYDGSGNVVRATQYAGQITPTSTYSLSYVQGEISNRGLASASDNRVTRNAFDGANRKSFSIDAQGQVTAFAYDAADRVVKTTRFNQTYNSSAFSNTDLVGWTGSYASSADRVDRLVYDKAGRAVFSVDAAGYLTEQQYDAAGRVTKSLRHAAVYAISDGDTPASVQGKIGSSASQAAASSYAYDTAGRLTDVTDAMGFVTHSVLDAMGQATSIKQAYGTTDESETQQVYDKAGRLMTQTRAYGAPEASTTRYTYDGVGRVKTIKDGQANATNSTYVVEQFYDAAGRLTLTRTPLASGQSAETGYKYDAFGHVAEVTDPRGNKGYFYYDRLGRQELQIDPEGYATETSYTLGGEVASLKRYYTATSGASISGRPSLPSNAKDAVTRFERDKLDRLTKTTDAEDKFESYTLNAFGDRIITVNKLGGTVNRTFDALGRVKTETMAIVSTRSNGSVQVTSVTNRFDYDARGNQIKRTEAEGLDEQRITEQSFDKLNRLTARWGDAVDVVTNRGNTTSSVVPTETFKYDGRGNLISQTDANLARTLMFYDDLGRKTVQIDALGAYTAWSYDANGNALTERAYATLVTQPTNAGGAAPAPPSGAYRQTGYDYDRANRLIKTTVSGVLSGGFNGSTFATNLSMVAERAYDAAGNLIREIDGRGSSIYHYYDRRGREIAKVDQANYLTTYTLDGEGNVKSETRFARALSVGVTTSSDPDQLRQAVQGSPDDRATEFTYDRNGRRLTETRKNVNAWSVGNTGAISQNGGTDATITYAYNGLGQVVRRTEATNGEATAYDYDQFGRLTTETGPAIINLNGYVRTLQTKNYYDALGNLTRTWQGAMEGEQTATDKVTMYDYANRKGARLLTVTDAELFKRNFAYDATGRTVRVSYDRKKSDNSTVREGTLYEYDALGRGVFQGSVQYNSSNGAWALSEIADQTGMRYDAFGAVVEQGNFGSTIPGDSTGWQVKYAYDGAGRVWKTNAGDGVYKLYVHDANGNLTATITSNGRDLNQYTTLDQALAALTNNGSAPLGSVAISDVVVTIEVFDARNQSVETREPSRQLLQTGGAALISHRREYNAFGETTLETNAIGGRIQYTYSTLGKVKTKQLLDANYTDRKGVSGAIPVETYYHDASGRLVATMNARGGVTSRILLAGTGYGDDEALYTSEFHADGGKLAVGYDVFKRARTLVDEVGNTDQRTYDKVDNLTKIYRPNVDGEGRVRLTDEYTYDGLGQRLTHDSNADGAFVNLQKTDYDIAGRVIKTVDYNQSGDASTKWEYTYAWVVDMQTTGLGAFGGWHKVTFSPSGVSQEDADYFGRNVKRVDEGNHVFSMSFDAAGRVTSQTNTVGQNLTYAYYNSGRIKTITDNAGGASQSVSWFEYDGEGNLTLEKFATVENSVQVVRKNARATYDKQSRRASYIDDGYAGNAVNLTYAYTAMNDIRSVTATYTLPTNGQSQGPTTYWFDYDVMNRMVISNGILDATLGVVRGPTGVAISFDQAGRRATASSYVLRTAPGGYSYWTDRIESYVYYTDGYLRETYLEEISVDPYSGTTSTGRLKMSSDDRDAMGRVTLHKEYRNGDTNNPVYSRQISYVEQNIGRDRNQIGSETTSTVQSDGSVLASQVTYLYAASRQVEKITSINTRNGAALSTVTSTYNIEQWDGVRQSSISVQTYTNQTGVTTTGTSTYAYDDNGKVKTVTINNGQRLVDFVNDSTGQAISRIETITGQSTAPKDFFFVFNGVRVGQTGNNGPVEFDYATSVANRGAAAASGPFVSRAFADFAQTYEPMSPTSRGEAATFSEYRVNEGDTLRSIALRLWGDEALWYMIAEANGLSASQALPAGMVLNIPNKVVNSHHKSSTFRVFDPSQVLGDVQPDAPAPTDQVQAQGKKKGCGGVGQILMVIVAVVVTYVVTQNLIAAAKVAQAGAAVAGATAATGIGFGTSVAIGATAAAAGSIASQGVGIAIGVQDRFSWKGVALAAVSGGVGGGVSQVAAAAGFSAGGSFATGAALGVGKNVLSQGISMAVGLQQRFDWAGVALAGITGGVDAQAGQWLAGQGSWNGLNLAQGGMANNAISGVASAVAGAATQSLLSGSDFGDNLLARLPDVIGNTIGNMIAGQIEQRAVLRAAAPAIAALDVELMSVDAQSVVDLSGVDIRFARLDGSLISWSPEMAGELTTIPNLDRNDVVYDLDDEGLQDLSAPAPQQPSSVSSKTSANAAPLAPPTRMTQAIGSGAASIVGKSPSLVKDMRALDQAGWRVKFGPNNGGTTTSKSTRTITLDGNLMNDPNGIAVGISHEVGHALDRTRIDTRTKASYLKSTLSGEGAATISNIRAQREIIKNGGPDIGVAGSNSAAYNAAYDRYLKDKQYGRATRNIGAVYGSREKTSNTREPYAKYYGNHYDKYLRPPPPPPPKSPPPKRK